MFENIREEILNIFIEKFATFSALSQFNIHSNKKSYLLCPKKRVISPLKMSNVTTFLV